MPRKKRQKWLPANVTEYSDRHGRRRYRFRKTGLPVHHFQHEPGTPEFEAELLEAQGGRFPGAAVIHRSMDDLARHLFRSTGWLGNKASTQYTYRRIIERYLDRKDRKGRRYGTYPAARATVSGLDRHIAELAATPSAANNLRKALKRMFNFAIKLGWIATNPADKTDALPTRKEGWHTWTDEEIARYRAYWPNGTMARLTLELGLNTAARKCNLAALEREHLVNGRWEISHVKDNDDTSVRITPEARAAIEALPAAPLRFFITGAHGRPYTTESLGNRFRKWAREADCPTTIHGLRKGKSRQLAESGATPLEGRAITGHKTDRTFAHYAARADRKTLADAAHAKLIGEPRLANLGKTDDNSEA